MPAARDAIVISVLITAVLLLVWNGSTFFRNVSLSGHQFGADVRIASTALTLNVALILFGWRRYAELQHEAQMREDSERRAAVLATTDPITALYNRKGFADTAGTLAEQAQQDGRSLVMLSIQINRFKLINDQHGYDVGDQLLRSLAAAMTEALGPDAVIARLSGDEFAAALALDHPYQEAAELCADRVLRAVTRPFVIDERMVQVGAFVGIAASAGDVHVPDLLRRADIALNHAKAGRVTRPIWFDAGMERALIAQGEIEQGIRYGLEHGQFVPFFRTAGEPFHRGDRRLRGPSAVEPPALRGD